MSKGGRKGCVRLECELIQWNSLKSGATKPPLSLACQQANGEVVQLLIGARADKSEEDRDGKTPLLVATSQGHVEVVKVLINAGVCKDKVDRHGRSPLWMAADHDKLEVARFLIKAGVQKDQIDAHGRSPLWIAANHGNVEIVELLIKARADKGKLDREGKSPLSIAKYRSHLDVVELLSGIESRAVSPATKCRRQEWVLWLKDEPGIKICILVGRNSQFFQQNFALLLFSGRCPFEGSPTHTHRYPKHNYFCNFGSNPKLWIFCNFSSYKHSSTIFFEFDRQHAVKYQMSAPPLQNCCLNNVQRMLTSPNHHYSLHLSCCNEVLVMAFFFSLSSFRKLEGTLHYSWRCSDCPSTISGSNYIKMPYPKMIPHVSLGVLNRVGYTFWSVSSCSTSILWGWPQCYLQTFKCTSLPSQHLLSWTSLTCRFHWTWYRPFLPWPQWWRKAGHLFASSACNLQKTNTITRCLQFQEENILHSCCM